MLRVGQHITFWNTVGTQAFADRIKIRLNSVLGKMILRAGGWGTLIYSLYLLGWRLEIRDFWSRISIIYLGQFNFN